MKILHFTVFITELCPAEPNIYKLASHNHVIMAFRRHAIKNKMSVSLKMRITFRIRMCMNKGEDNDGGGDEERLRRSIRMEIRMGMIFGNDDEVRMWMGVRIK